MAGDESDHSVGEDQIEFDIPFAPRISPDVGRARRHLIDWTRAYGLLRSDRAMSHFLTWQPAELPARFYPNAVQDDLVLATDLFGWLMLFDDQFDSVIGHEPPAVARIVNELIEVFDSSGSGTGKSASPARRALEDLWSREQEGMSERWRRRTVRHWREYLQSYVHEAENRYNNYKLSILEYLALRDKTGIMYVLLDMAERVGHYEVHESLYQDAVFQKMHRLAVMVPSIVNDLLGLTKEETQHDPHNLVLVIRTQQSCTRQQAVEQAVGMVGEWTSQFVLAEARIPNVCDHLHLDYATRIPGYRLIDDMRACMRGSYDWCATSRRYSAESIAHLNPTGYLDDIITAS
jgi:pentalenene synthase